MSRRERKALKNLKAQHAAQEKFDDEQAKKAEKKAKQEQARANWNAASPEEKSQTYKLMAVIAVTVVVLFAILASCSGGDDSSQKDESPTVTAQHEEPAVEEESSDLGAEVEAALLAANGISSFTELSPTSPGWAITSIESMSSSTVRIHVQESLSPSDKERTGSWAIKMTCEQVPALDTVVVRDTSGLDTNVFKRNVGPLPNGCS